MEAHVEQVYLGSQHYTGNYRFLTLADQKAIEAFEAFLDVFNPALKGYAQYTVRLDVSNVTGARVIGIETVGMPVDGLQPANETV